MRDRKFIVAVLIILVLAIALLYVTVIGPNIQGYFIKKQTEAQTVVVRAIIGVVEQQGYVVLTDEDKSVLLVRYEQGVPAQVQNQPIVNPEEQPEEQPGA